VPSGSGFPPRPSVRARSHASLSCASIYPSHALNPFRTSSAVSSGSRPMKSL
jgi:hypothetical protein